MANPYLSCGVCGEPLPKYTLDRFSDDLCGEHCAGIRRGREECIQAILDAAKKECDSSSSFVLGMTEAANVIRRVVRDSGKKTNG